MSPPWLEIIAVEGMLGPAKKLNQFSHVFARLAANWQFIIHDQTNEALENKNENGGVHGQSYIVHIPHEGSKARLDDLVALGQ